MDVSVVGPEGRIWDGQADLVIARSPEGEFGIMRGHVPFLAALVPGRVTVVSGNTRDVFLVTGGFLEASGSPDDYHVIILADDAESAADIDLNEARERLEAARRRAQENTDDETEAELRVAMARVDLANG